MGRFRLPDLPYSKEALKPFLSGETIECHYGKHHSGYVEKMNEMLQAASSEWPADVSLEEIVLKSQGGLFNQASQAWNHSFYWYGLSPDAQSPQGRIAQSITESFGSYESFCLQFIEKGVGLFGSGWVWLVKDVNNHLEVMTTANAENPLRQKRRPLLNCDVWEHAYYIDFRNERKKYLQDFFRHVNWRFVEENLIASKPASMSSLMKITPL